VFEQPCQVGDEVSVGDHYGAVVDIGIRSRSIVTPNDTAVVVPNVHSLDRSIADATTSDAAMLVTVPFYVDPDADVSRARAVVEDELYYRTVTGKADVADLRAEERFNSAVSERVLAAFETRGIDSPRVPAPE